MKTLEFSRKFGPQRRRIPNPPLIPLTIVFAFLDVSDHFLVKKKHKKTKCEKLPDKTHSPRQSVDNSTLVFIFFQPFPYRLVSHLLIIATIDLTIFTSLWILESFPPWIRGGERTSKKATKRENVPIIILKIIIIKELLWRLPSISLQNSIYLFIQSLTYVLPELILNIELTIQ